MEDGHSPKRAMWFVDTQDISTSGYLPMELQHTLQVHCCMSLRINAGFFNLSLICVFKSCGVWKWSITLWVTLSTLAPGNLILGMRLHNLYGKSRIVRLALTFGITIEIMIHITISSIYSSRLSSVPIPSTIMSNISLGCVVTLHTLGRYYNGLVGVAGLILTLFYFGLAWRSFSSHVQTRSALQGSVLVRTSGSLSSLFSLLYRDGVLIYAIIFVVSLFNEMILVTEFNHTLSAAGVPWLAATYAIACPRLMLLLRGDPSNSTGVYKVGTEYVVEISMENRENDDIGAEVDFNSFLPSVASMQREFRKNWQS